MKKILTFILIFSLMLFPMNVFASSSSNEIEYLDNGDYLIYTIEDDASRNFQPFSNTVTKSKYARYYHKNSVQWYVKVTGTFTYGSGTSKCTSSSVSAKSSADGWKIVNSSASKSKNTASATATAKHYYNNSVIDTVTRTVKLTCSSTGKFS
ncbi:hypothetical protein H8S07_03905 [Dorea sp. NSJ-36]|uniref:Uncharacterized protein n=1 Tax=Dorea hominis TaxID=2763040 RepID=A0ABR7ESU9_9FIRM|nr:hypothetical protein [Dorea hominis]MBC5664430.1 hypothetical protein [Dorea hominis]